MKLMDSRVFWVNNLIHESSSTGCQGDLHTEEGIQKKSSHQAEVNILRIQNSCDMKK